MSTPLATLGNERTSRVSQLSKDQLVLSMLAVLGGETREVSERELFLACWHAFPNAMRWADTALPNPDTFTASLRRLDAGGVLARVGKQERKVRKRAQRAAFESGRSGVVKARIPAGGLQRAGLTKEDITAVGSLVVSPDAYRNVDPGLLVLLCLEMREGEGRLPDEGALLETAFHRFPATFAYGLRPEFPDTERLRDALLSTRDKGWVDDRLRLTALGRSEADAIPSLTPAIDQSAAHRTGAFRLAARLEATIAFARYEDSGTISGTKGDELFRALRLPPTFDQQRIANAFMSNVRELRRIDRGDIIKYLAALAHAHNPEVLPLIELAEPGFLEEFKADPQGGPH